MSTRQLLLLTVVVLAVLLVNSLYVVDQRSVAVLLEFDKFKATVTEPGLHFKEPLTQSVIKYNHRLLSAGQNDSVLSSDQKKLNVEYYVKWRIADVPTYYRVIGMQDQVAGDRLINLVSRSVHDVLGARSIEQIATGDRDELSNALRQQAQDKVRELGIELVDVRIEELQLPKEVAEGYYERMRAERRRMADETRARGNEEAEAIRAAADSEAETTQAEAYRKAETLRGEGDAKAAEIYAKAYGEDPEFFAFYRSLAAYRDAFKGKPEVIVVEPKGEFFKYFKDPGTGNGK
jgi:membrane protease subunit HflC